MSSLSSGGDCSGSAAAGGSAGGAFAQFPIGELMDACKGLRVVSAGLSAPVPTSVPGAGVDAGPVVNAAMARFADAASEFAETMIATIDEFGQAADGVAVKVAAADLSGPDVMRRIHRGG